MIPISSVKLPPNAATKVTEVINSGRLAQGAVVAEFERRFADLAGARDAVAVNNGTTALVAALQVLDLKPGDEVITTPFTFVATLNAILEAGATAVFCDISTDDFNLDPDLLSAAISPRSRTVMPVHLYGQMAPMDQIAALAQSHGLTIVEDAAQAHGATFEGHGAGSYGLGCFSFYGTKNLTTGEGGLITVDDDVLADRLRVLRNQGMRARYEYVMAGHNYRLTDLQAALVLPQLDAYPTNLAARRANSERLNTGLAGIDGLITPRQLPGREHVWHQYTIRLTEAAKLNRDDFIGRLNQAEIGNGIYYPRTVFDYDCYRNHPQVRISSTPVATSIAGQVLSLPVHPNLTEANIDYIIETIRGLLA